MVNIEEAYQQVIRYWQAQSIPLTPGDLSGLSKEIFLPNDFLHFYSGVNGMEKLSPNYTDKKGFLFYPVEHLQTYQEEQNYTRKQKSGFVENLAEELKVVVLFADYMQASWKYGLKVDAINPQQYEIGIIAYPNSFIPVTTSLPQFLALYLEDAPELYDF